MNEIQVEALTFYTASEAELKNFQETLRIFLPEKALLEKLLSSYKTFIRALNKSKMTKNDIPTIKMFFVCLREFIISAQLVGQGHFSEGYALISRASEAVGYGATMKLDVKKAEIWIEKSGRKEFRELFGEPFPKNNNLLHPVIFNIYNTTRDYGTHTNFGSTIHFTSIISETKFEFVYCDFNDIKWVKRNLLWVIHSFTEFLIVFKKLFPEGLESNWLKTFDEYLKEWISYKESSREFFSTETIGNPTSHIA